MELKQSARRAPGPPSRPRPSVELAIRWRARLGRIAAVGWLASMAIAGAASAQAPGEAALLRVERVLAGARMALVDGRILRLAGIRASPADDQARAWLEQLAGRGPLRVLDAETSRDRWGDLVAQVASADGVWLQGALLERGLAQVRTRPGEVARAAEMLALEHAARTAGRGLWALPASAARPASELAAGEQGFRIVHGRVLRVEATRHYVYLNFGADWRSDFTVRVRRADLAPAFDQAGLDVLALGGRRVEVRGLVISAGGPLIELSHPQQMEVLP